MLGAIVLILVRFFKLFLGRSRPRKLTERENLFKKLPRRNVFVGRPPSPFGSESEAAAAGCILYTRITDAGRSAGGKGRRGGRDSEGGRIE